MTWPTLEQIELIETLMNEGAPIPCTGNGDPDLSMFDTTEKAAQYIRDNIHYADGDDE